MQKVLTGVVLLLMIVQAHAQWQFLSPNTYFTGGKVGIGTSNPERTLHISGSGASGVETMIQATDDGYAMLDLKSNDKTWQWSKRPSFEGDALGLYFHNGTIWTGPHCFITPNGGIGIGTTKTSDANYKLFVETGIRTRKVVVDLATWPDYVFHPGYALPSLPAVAAYIKTHHHLPDMPSADSVARNGVDLGNNQAQLLKKIEELTLYIIDQDQRLQQQKEEIEKLKARLPF